MYAICQKAEIAGPLKGTGLAVAAFEDMPLKQALVFVQINQQNIEDLSWAFEQRVKELKGLPGG